jgi:hypothetical protein
MLLKLYIYPGSTPRPFLHMVALIWSVQQSLFRRPATHAAIESQHVFNCRHIVMMQLT